MKKLLMASLLVLMLPGSSQAEKADSLKQFVVLFEKSEIDDINKTTVLTGKVSYTKGTLVLEGAKAILREDVDGNQSLILTAAPGAVATFRQKRDGGPDLWMEGQSQRIEYDGGKEVVTLSGVAKIKQLEGGKVMYETKSEFISYDSRTEKFVAMNDASGQSKPGQGRGMIIGQPRLPKPAPATSAPTAGKQ
jgi:lipopolysaccharide export system protein LptA